jgi:electron transfer flavoprotein beta subunit
VHIVVCIKSVPDTTEVRFNPETHTLMRDQAESIINPFDMYAIEEALRLQENHGGTVTVVTMGPPKAEKELREAVAMGCDAAVLLSAAEYAGSDTWATAYVLAAAIHKLAPVDLVICGRQAPMATPARWVPGIARQLGIPLLTYVQRVRRFDPTAGEIEVERLVEEGREVVAAGLPALLTVVKDINSPRYPTFRGIRAARRMEIPVWTPADLPGTDPALMGLTGSPTRVVSVFTPPPRDARVEWISGDSPEEIAAQLSERLQAEHIV